MVELIGEGLLSTGPATSSLALRNSKIPLKRSFCYARPYPGGLEPEPDGPYGQMVSQSQLDRKPGEIKDR